MKKYNKIINITLVIIILLGICFIVYFFINKQKNVDLDIIKDKAIIPSSQIKNNESTQELQTKKDYPDLNIDFDYLNSVNDDIFAWIYIPNTKVNHPVLFNQDDNSYYLTHDYSGKVNSIGSIFIEDYNTTTLNDRVTLIYGHNMRDGDQFGTLDSYSDIDFFNKNQKMYIYTKADIKEYSLLFATPYTDKHLMFWYDMNDNAQFKNLIYTLSTVRHINSNYIDNIDIQDDDKIIILSTCYYDGEYSRYLVAWKLNQ